MRRYKMTVTTDGSGNATAYSPRVSGKVHSVQYLKDGATGYTDGVDLTVTAEATGESIVAKSDVNASAVFYPRAATHTQAGAAALYASGGVAVLDKIAIANDRVKVVLGSGGASKVGTFHVLIDD